MEIKNYFAQDAQGNIMPSANCYLYLPDTTTLATGLIDGNGVPISNPFLASSVGQVEFGAPNGVYDLRVALGARDWTIKVQCADIVQAMDVMDSILGSHAENPASRNNGQPLQPGDETWNSTEKQPYWWNGSSWLALNSSTAALDAELASMAGAKKLGWVRTKLRTAIANVASFLDSSSIRIWESEHIAKVTERPDPTDPRTWIWHPALQSAVDYVKALAEEQGHPYGLPAIIVPGFIYPMNAGINTKPWITIVSDGSTLFDFRQAPDGTNGFTCDNFTSIPIDALKFPGNHAPYLNGSGGSIALWGPGKGVSTGSAVKSGNMAAGGKPFRDASICNVVATGWRNAQEWGNHDTYICRTDDCRFEAVENCIKTQSGAGVNSGERMVWAGCTFGGYDVALNHDINTFDAYFESSNSFDFGVTTIKFGPNSNYCSAVLDMPYVEAVDNLIVDATAVTGTAEANQISVTINKLQALPRNYASSKSFNSPSRRLFDGKFSLILRDSKFRHETRPYLEDGALIGPDVTVVAATGYHQSPQRGPLHLGAVLNVDFDFQKDADATNGDALTAWERVAVSNCARDLFTVAGKKVLRLVGTSGTNTSNCTMRSKQKIPARMGDVFFVNGAMYASGATGSVTMQARMEYFDDADVSLGQFPVTANYSFADALADTTLPNYVSGGSTRWMDTGAFRSVAPANTAYAKMRFTIISFDGTVYVSRARCWKM